MRENMTTTLTLNDHLVELGSLSSNQDVSMQRVGARAVEHFLDTYNANYQPDKEATGHLLYYLTDIQVRDYSLGLLDPAKSDIQIPALEYLLIEAPTDTEYINAPAALLASLQYELGNAQLATYALNNASNEYSLAKLLHRVFAAEFPLSSMASMRAELHPKVTAGIFGKDK